MKKFFRNLFSGYFLVFLILALEVIAFAFFQYFANDLIVSLIDQLNWGDKWAQVIVSAFYLTARIAVTIIAIVTFLRIVNKQEDPEFKIPWIVGMMIFPFFFAAMYWIFANHGLRRKEKKVMAASNKACEEHFKDNKSRRNEYTESLGHASGVFKYLNNTTGLGIHTNNKITYYKCGEEFFPAFKEGLKKAKEFIFIEFFIISDGKEWSEVRDILIEKAKEGVEVRLIYDDMGCGGTIAARTPRMLRKYGIKCYKFHPFRPILSGIYNNRSHRKIVIVDHQMAFTGGINLADEYANEIVRFGYWKDTMIKIEGSAINNLIITFLQNFDLSNKEVSDYNKYISYTYPKYDDTGFVMPFGDGPGGIDDALVGEQNYINIINYAKKRVDISTPYLIPTYELLDTLRNAALRGVEVNLIVPGIPDKKIVYQMAKSNFRYLLDAGVNIYTYAPGFNHMKSAIADGELAFVGTINYDFRSLVHHFECGATLYKCDCMEQIQKDFDEMILVSDKVPQTFKMRWFPRLICSVLKVISALL